ncbi:MAG: LytTR family transcriptional regulator DNA-binding domain-containing protein [Bacteroidia bacterium]
MQEASILVVEDEMIIAADISMALEEAGCKGVVFWRTALESAKTRPDLVMMDINLKGDIDGVETAKVFWHTMGIPVIFLTANTDKATFERAKAAEPFGFIAKPFDHDDLERVIELAFMRLGKMDVPAAEAPPSTQLEGCIFIKHKDKMVRVNLDDIIYIQAEDTYCNIHTQERSYLQSNTLKSVEQALAHPDFVRIHRSYIINLRKLEALGEVYAQVAGKELPVSRSRRAELVERLRTL